MIEQTTINGDRLTVEHHGEHVLLTVRSALQAGAPPCVLTRQEAQDLQSAIGKALAKVRGEQAKP